MKRIYYTFIFLSIISLSNCKKENSELVQPITKSFVSGLVQKGPFINGSTICFTELQKNLSPTGKAYTTQIINNSGLFEIKDISFVSQYVQLKADGFYFNEITGKPSTASITLYALTDISDKTSINVNIISHLEKSRIEYLISQGQSFADAKKQAESEVLKIFSLNKLDIIESESLDISKDGENNAILLAISVICQGFRSEAELTELLANISSDIRTDGILNSTSLGSALISDAKLFDLTKIRVNIEKRYTDLGINATIPDFEKYIKLFTENSTYTFTSNITYPEFSNYGENILYGEKTTFTGGLSLAAHIPTGRSLKIVIKNGIWYFNMLPNGPVNWNFTTYDNSKQEQTFTTIESDKDCDLMIDFETGSHTIEYYENNSSTPTRVKTIIK